MKSHQVLLQNNKSFDYDEISKFSFLDSQGESPEGFLISNHLDVILWWCLTTSLVWKFSRNHWICLIYTTFYLVHYHMSRNIIKMILICDIDGQNNKGAFPSKGTEGCIFELKFLSSIKVFNNLKFKLEEWICFKEGHYWYNQLKMKHASSTTHSCCPK